MNTLYRSGKILALVLIFLSSSCSKDFEDINKDPHGFTTASDGSLFNSIIESLQLGWNEQFYINNEILYKQTQLAALTQEGWGNFTLGTNNSWENYYGVLPEVRELEKRFSEEGDEPEVINMRAMLKIVLAYKTFKLTDIFGDIPFSDAGYGFQDLQYLHPKFDRQENIYEFLLGELRWADENIDVSATQEPFATFQAFDKLFNGNLSDWRKFANSLSLRYAMRMFEKKPDLAKEIIIEIIENNRPVFQGYDLITPVLESACLWPATTGFSNESTFWSFSEHKNLRMGSNIWNQLSENDNPDGSGIFDPRAFIFFETNNDTLWKPYPQIPDISTPSSGGLPYSSGRDKVGYYNLKGENCIYSPFNYFIIRDPDYIPIILITGAEVHFIKAEAYFRGIGVAQNSANAETEYMNGINASVDWWKQVAEDSKLPLSGLEFPDMIKIPNGVNVSSILEKFGFWNVSSDEEKLEFIYTQRWLDAFKQPWEAYSITRRTNKTPREGDPINHFRMPYPPTEVEYNTDNWSKALSNQGGGDTPEYKIWWVP